MSHRVLQSGLAMLFVLSAMPVFAQLYPLSENTWSNPEFVERFRGSYGVATEVEPSITPEEAELFNTIVTQMQTDPRGAARTLQASLTPESSPALYYVLASLNLQDGRIDEAIRNFRTAIKAFPNFRRAYRNLGLAYVQKGDFEEAVPVLVKAIELGDGSSLIFGLLAYSHLSLGNFDAALDGYELALLLDHDNKDWRVGKAQALLSVQNYNRAAEVFRELIKNDPDNTNYYKSLVNAYIAQGEENTAAGILEVIRRMGKSDSSSLYTLGDIYMNQGILRAAYQAYMDALRIDDSPSSRRILRTAGILVQWGEYERAAAYIDRVEELRGATLDENERGDLLSLRAELAMNRGDREQVLLLLEQVIEIDPFDGKALLLLAEFYEQDGDVERAVYYYERAQKVSESKLDALISHARLRVHEREYDEAIDLLEEAQSIQRRSNVQEYLDAIRRVSRM